MLLLLAAYLGGALTIASPCILPVLPFVFARAGGDFRRNGLPLLAGLTVTFAAVASLAAVGGTWAAAGNQIGRWAALAFLALMGAALAFPGVAAWAMRPFVGLGERVSARADAGGGTPGGALLTGIACGLVWAPCAGPILGLVLGGAALSGGNAFPALAAYGLGSATSLAVALLAGGRLVAAVKRRLEIGETIRRGLGVLVLAGVALSAAGTETLARWSAGGTDRLEQAILDRFPALRPAAATAAAPLQTPLVALSGATSWLNGPALSAEALKGKVVLIDFWTYSCINCLRSIPHVRAWDETYRSKGLVTIGVHTPEFAFEKIEGNVAAAVSRLGIRYPVALDNAYAMWSGFSNQYWPAHYLLDGTGRIRYTHFGEGEEEKTEQAIRDLLQENGARLEGRVATAKTTGLAMPADFADVKTPETYVGYARVAGFASPEGLSRDAAQTYTLPSTFALNQWALAGGWTMAAEDARLNAANGRIALRFHARDLHLVLGPAADGKPVRFRVLLDGAPPGPAAGMDADAQGFGQVTENRLYQLIRQPGGIADRDFSIEFLDSGVQAFAFTFG
ncbi:cytochrome c biogenesis protein DipZ [Oleispirillum naphthae]|uniref:cytochrome c biogenesis protein DipZ n=1 Tax=Oleispirillum naphthae TaxID=2838853 RepID=UPI00308235D4